ncbi:transglutaminase TgpA family protein [Aquibacillus kalidii]|uniref:transglutaminase TgpA family protein n=1 Tax=Aquibacillus kalidii TaxID=2762597 RepID=UPI002E28B127|nr:transglutaminaseTgpA domain-containing protein [Aquibacillus kalidii]
MNRLSHNMSLIYQSIIYVCGFFLFWEWLRPLDTITDTGSVPVFVIFTGFCFFLSLLKVKWWISSPLKIAGIIFIIDSLFIPEGLFSPGWFQVLVMHIQFNFEVMLNQDWSQMTPLFRSMLFLVLLWLMSYLLYYWCVVANRIFLFVLLTFIYITVLDTFTSYGANIAIVRTFIVSLLAMGIASFMKEMDKESIKFVGIKKISAWLIPIVAVISFSTVVGFAAPKLTPQWPDPVPFIKSTAENAGFGEGANTVQKVGYGEDDSQLGGSFVQDYSPVFRATVEKKHYWRIESKDFYTGKGWERSTELNYDELYNGEVNSRTFSDTVKTDDYRAYIDLEPDANLPKVVYPYGINAIQGNENVQYLMDRTTGSMEAEGPEVQGVLDEYAIDYSYPSFSLEQLIASSNDDPLEIQSLYLQLPTNLPERVRGLAEEVTNTKKNRYEKVKAIESYFSMNGYQYQTTDVAIPGKDDDYVDQFLFETKIGYCDNFSTSMVVMLRTLDIPARWVKGFSGGQKIDVKNTTIPGEAGLYQISNSNAHSWVEVYFPEVGWVPFEPTKGFNSPVDFYEESSALPEGTETETPTPEEQEQQTEQRQRQAQERLQEEEESKSGMESSNNMTWQWYVIGGLVLIVLVYLYLARYRIASYFLLRKYEKRSGVKVYQQAYHFLLKVLEHKGYKRETGQTLREYAKYIDTNFQSADMSRLTYHYERILYRNEMDSNQWENMTELWKNLIKRSLS